MREYEIDIEFNDLARIMSDVGSDGIIDGFNEDIKDRFAEEIWNTKLDYLQQLKNDLSYNRRKLLQNEKLIAGIRNKKKLAIIKKDIEIFKTRLGDIQNKLNLVSTDINNTNKGLENDVKCCINLQIDRNEVFEYYEIIKKMYSLLQEMDSDRIINIDIYEDLRAQETTSPVNYTYTIEQFNSLVELYNHMNGYKKTGNRESGEIFFTDDVSSRETPGTRLSLGDVYFINKRITDIVDYIKQKQFTPYEAMIYIHYYLSGLEYFDSEKCFAQMITGPLLGQEIVCSGYASLTKAIIDRLDMPGLKCEIQGLNNILPDKSGYGDFSHAVCLIDIIDKKYDINSLYYDDISSDSIVYGDVFAKGSEESELYKDLTGSYEDGRFTYFLYPQCDTMLFIEDGKHKYMAKDNALNRYEQIIYIETKDKDLEKDLEDIN